MTMHPKFTLRTRIVLAFLAFGVVLSSLFAAVALSSMADFERILMTELLQAETRSLIVHLHAEPTTPLPASRRIFAYVSHTRDHHDVPAEMASLRPGTHVLGRQGDRETYVAVRDDGPRRLYFIIDLSDIAQRETFLRWLMAGVILLGTLVSGALGILLAGRLIAPVRRLVQWVDAAVPPRHGAPVHARFADDEVGALALAFERYQARLDAFLKREREFTADTSHELRSPLSVIQGGLDLLVEEPTLSAPGRRAIERLRRSTTEMADLLDALLYLARHENTGRELTESVAVHTTWQRLLDARPDASAPVHLRSGAEVMVRAPLQAAILVFSQLLRRAIEQADGAPVSVVVSSEGIALSPWPPLDPLPRSGQTRSDSRFGLALISRLCARLGWTMHWPISEGGALRLTFDEEKAGHDEGESAGDLQA